MERLYEFRNIFYTATEIRKLEKVEIGGLMGRMIGRKVDNILDEFNALYSKWNNIQYDPLDVEDLKYKEEEKEYNETRGYTIQTISATQFKVDEARFHQKVVTLERKLALQFILALNECYTIEALVKFLKLTGNLLQRPTIFSQVKGKIHKIVKHYNTELCNVKKIFDG